MKICIFGAEGLLGVALQEVFFDCEVVAYDLPAFDVLDFVRLKNELQATKPDAVINCVAWNDVDGAEQEKKIGDSGGVNRALLLNSEVPLQMARICSELLIPLITYSTDNVFEGNLPNGYDEQTQQNPVNAYGESKYRGEENVKNSCEKFYIIRTSRLYGNNARSKLSKQSFVNLVIQLLQKNIPLQFVDEEPGAFTNVVDLARATQQLLNEKFAYGIYHLVNEGSGTWYDCARLIADRIKKDATIQPVTRAEFPRSAHVPRYSILLNTKAPHLPDWKDSMNNFLALSII